MILLLAVGTIALTVMNKSITVNPTLKEYIPDKATFSYSTKVMDNGVKEVCVFIDKGRGAYSIGCSHREGVTEKDIIEKYLAELKRQQEYKASEVVSETQGEITIK